MAIKNSPRKQSRIGGELSTIPISSSTLCEPGSSSGRGCPQNPELFPALFQRCHVQSISPRPKTPSFHADLHRQSCCRRWESTFTLLLMAQGQHRCLNRGAMPGARGESLVFGGGSLGKLLPPAKNTHGREQSEHGISARSSSVSAGNESPRPAMDCCVRTGGELGQDGGSTAPPPPFWWHSCRF